MVLVVEATRAGSDVLEVHLALVPHAVHVGGPARPRHVGHTSTRLRVPAPDVRHFADLSFSTCTEEQQLGSEKLLELMASL